MGNNRVQFSLLPPGKMGRRKGDLPASRCSGDAWFGDIPADFRGGKYCFHGLFALDSGLRRFDHIKG